MIERQNSESFHPEINHKSDVERKLDGRMDRPIRLAEQIEEIIKDSQFIRDNNSVVFDENIDGIVDRVFVVDSQTKGVPTTTSKPIEYKDEFFSESKTNGVFIRERTFRQKLRKRVIESEIVKRGSSLLVAVITFLQLGSALPVQAETQSSGNPNTTNSSEADETNSENNFPTVIEDQSLTLEHPLEESNTTDLNSILYGFGNESYMTSVQLMRSGENLKRYDAELVNCKPELKSFCFDLLLLLDNSKAFVDRNDGITDFDSTMISHYLERETIIKFGETGKGLKTINFKNGLPAIGLVNVSKDVENCLRQAVNDWQKDVPDFLEVCYENGMRVFYQNKVDTTGGTWSKYDEYGVYLYNCDKNDVTRKKESGITKNLKIALVPEVFGIKSRILGITQDAFEAVVKQFLAFECSSAMYKKTGRDFYKDMMESNRNGYDLYMSMCGDPEKATAIIDEIKRSNLIRPFSAENWQDINAILSQ